MATMYRVVCDCGQTWPRARTRTLARARYDRAHTCPAREPDADREVLDIATQAARYAMRRYRLPTQEYADVLSDAALGATQAALRWDAARGARRSWLYTRANGAIIDGLRASGYVPRARYARGTRVEDLPAHMLPPIPLDAPHSDDPNLTLDGLAPAPDMIEAADTRIALAQALACLTDKERRVLLAVTVEGYTLQQVAAALGVTEGRACQIRGQALARARLAAAS